MDNDNDQDSDDDEEDGEGIWWWWHYIGIVVSRWQGSKHAAARQAGKDDDLAGRRFS
jgi:hypothetical protein